MSSLVLTMTLARLWWWLPAAGRGEKSTAVSWLQSTSWWQTEHEAWLRTPEACLSHHNTLWISLLLWKASSCFWIAPFPQFLGVGSGRGPSWHKTSTLHLSGSGISLGTESSRIARYHLCFHGTPVKPKKPSLAHYWELNHRFYLNYSSVLMAVFFLFPEPFGGAHYTELSRLPRRHGSVTTPESFLVFHGE